MTIGHEKKNQDTIDPMVSVIIPTYKRPLTLSRAIDSVLASTWKNLEVIVVDDNNEGDQYRIETEILLQKYLQNYSNVIYIKHTSNKNGSAARNTGFKESHGQFVMFLDDDDEFYPEKVEDQVRFMMTHDDTWGACYTKYVDVKEGKIVSRGTESVSGSLLLQELSRNLYVHAGSNLMVRRSVVEELNGFDETFQRNQDVEFLVRLLRFYKLGYVDTLGLIVHVHPRNYSVDYFELTRQYIRTFQDDFDALPKDDRMASYRMIGLQMFRQALQSRKLKLAFDIKEEFKLSTLHIIYYFNYMAIRLIAKKSYGFPMRYLY